jgi:hypothetical protein
MGVQQRIARLAVVIVSIALQPCSVGMAASGNKPQDTSIIFPGSNRAVIMSKLGPPDTTRTLDDGNTEDTFLVKQGNEASSGRAWAFAGLDLLSLGLWEAVATPYELAQTEEKSRWAITYDPAGNVVKVQKFGTK